MSVLEKFANLPISGKHCMRFSLEFHSLIGALGAVTHAETSNVNIWQRAGRFHTFHLTFYVEFFLP